MIPFPLCLVWPFWPEFLAGFPQVAAASKNPGALGTRESYLETGIWATFFGYMEFCKLFFFGGVKLR